MQSSIHALRLGVSNAVVNKLVYQKLSLWLDKFQFQFEFGSKNIYLSFVRVEHKNVVNCYLKPFFLITLFFIYIFLK